MSVQTVQRLRNRDFNLRVYRDLQARSGSENLLSTRAGWLATVIPLTGVNGPRIPCSSFRKN